MGVYSAYAVLPQPANKTSAHTIELSWSELKAPNKKDNVERYNVYRVSAEQTGEEIKCGSDWKKIGFTMARARRYVDANVAAGKAYCYAVTAVDARGESANSLVRTAVVPSP